MDAVIQVVVDVNAAENELYGTMSVKNLGKVPVYVDVRYIPQGKYLSSDPLHVVCDGKNIRFSGSRYNLGRGEYYKIEPGESEVSGNVELARNYLIPPGNHNCNFYMNVWATTDPVVINDDRAADFFETRSNVFNLEVNNSHYEKVYNENH
ncbi:hypothetical protein CHU32_14310 [Superficieibacter electus]|uniref:CARDB domain-containing protein n=1 Tax=Superficieibacter electus TaxID=2022662 RepID=A0A2P5GN97_9ENTR|nr:hypothetical protein [Superficieibacter electus]POP43552.1 hypothetical protein CHU33_15020 [Superficieibacter electus]POP48020.1 hypothetical protein CHU32_14310 [Superficieibacter electus]